MRFKIQIIAACLAATQAVAGGAAAGAPNTIEVKQAWIRWLPGPVPAGGYLTLMNSGDQAISLVGAASAAYGSVALHRSQMRDGMDTMVPVQQLTIAPHSVLDFASQGYHLMLSAPNVALKPGDHVPVTLKFAGGGVMTVQFELRRPDGSAVR